MFIKLTNMAPDFKGMSFLIKKDLIVSVFSSKVDRENGVREDVTLVFVPPHGTWEVSETVEEIQDLLNSTTTKKSSKSI